MKKFSVLIILLILFNTIFLSGQTTRNVPAQYATIQAGLNAAQSGDTVLVQPGTYKENIVWPNVNGIKLVAAQNSENTIIDGNMVSSCITMISDGSIDSNTLISNFSIINGGNVNAGGGLVLISAGPKIMGCRISYNNSTQKGGGIYLKGGKPIIESCIISENTAQYGGGIFAAEPGTEIRINASSISQNIVQVSGGGLYLYLYNTVSITNSFIDKNTASEGGGVYTDNSGYLNVTNSSISFNIANSRGGAKYGMTTGYFKHVKFIGNRGHERGLGDFGADTLKNCTIANNSTTGNSPNSELISIPMGCFIENSQIVSNSTTSNQLIMVLGNNNPTIFKNVTFFNNRNSQLNSTFIRSWNDPISMSITNSNFQGNGKAIVNDINYVITNASNNWWGISSGPYHPSQNPTGLGDSVNMFVNVTPWLTIPDTTAPPIPAQNVKISSSGKDYISLTWDTSLISDLKGYKIYYDTDSSSYPYSNSIDVENVTTYKITGLGTGQKYYIAVVVYDLGGNESWYSNEVSATTVPPLLAVTSSAIFLNSVLGDSSSIILPIISASSSALTLSSVANNLSNFSHGITVPTIVNGNDTLKLKITFKPSILGTVTDTLKITSDGGNASVVLTGTSPYPVLVSSSSSLSYGTVARNSTKQLGITISNTSINKLTVDSIYTKTSIFTVDKNNGSVGTDTLSLNITFTPTTVGAFTDTLYLRNNSETALVKIPLGGITPSSQIVSAVNFVSFNFIVLKDSAVSNLIIRNTSITLAQISKVTVGSYFRIMNDSLKVVSGKDSVILTLVYKPLAYGTHSDTVKIESDGGNLNIPVEGSSPYPEILIPQSQIALGSIGVFDSLKLQLYIKNKSINQLNIDSVYTNTVSFTAVLQKSNVTQIDSSQLIISFSTAKYGSLADTVYFKSNAQVPLYKLPLSAFVPYPYLSVNKTLIDFGAVLKDSLKQLTVTLKDTSISRLSIDSILTKTKYFTATLTGTNKILTKKDSAIVLVEFKPDTIKQFVDTLYIFNSSPVNPFKIALSANGIISGINADAGLIPDHYSLSQNFPNPFNPSTVIRYALPFDSKVLIKIYNVLGQDVKLLKDEIISAGNYEVQFNSSSLSSGVYFYRLSAESVDGKQKYSSIKKMILLK